MAMLNATNRAPASSREQAEGGPFLNPQKTRHLLDLEGINMDRVGQIQS